MSNPLVFGVVGFILAGRCAAFNLYPPIDPAKLASAYNVTLDCINALNESLPACDSTLFQMVVDVDNYYWQDDNVTTLCGGNCSAAAQQWDEDVNDACDGQYLNAYGRLVPAWSVADRFVDGMNLACLGSNTADEWCLPASLNWTGSDIVRPDCTASPSDPQCANNATAIDPSNQRLANLYSDDVLCDSCFIQMLYTRVSSPYFPDADQLGYLADQLQDIGDICNATIPDITVRGDPSYTAAPTPTSINFLNSTSTTAAATSTTCAGQTVKPASKRHVNAHARDVHARQNAANCDTLSQQYGVTTGDLQALTGSATCTISTAICLPAKCTLAKVQTGSSCDSLASSSGNVTTIQFLNWNPNIMGLCDSLTAGQYICVSPPGGTYTLAPPPLGTSADAGNQQRGGAGGVVTPTTTATNTLNPASALPGPTATQAGIAASCNNYAEAKSGDDCYDFAVAHSIAPSQLYAWNPVLGSNGANCSTKFWASEYYCIGTATTGSVTTTSKPATTTSTATQSIPSPTQSGIAKNCNKYVIAKSGDDCYDFAIAQNITPAQLYSWNPVLGTNGASCSTQFQAGEYYCVGVSGSSTTTTSTPPTTKATSTSTKASSTTKPTSTTTTKAAAPSPTQSGIAKNCNKYVIAKSGDDCYDFATANGITPTQLYTWNTGLGTNGANCSTQFQAGVYYCVGVSS